MAMDDTRIMVKTRAIDMSKLWMKQGLQIKQGFGSKQELYG